MDAFAIGSLGLIALCVVLLLLGGCAGARVQEDAERNERSS